ncbi:carboxypeptidase-like regulatory domain-containing protein [Gillisia hiemivivida]|uniref:Carboxypeptidase-like regulatory domain-containing protein n=1 Tax=Gillisia hiemivivida TaxID=291190 RepID=A0A5C6ZS42_9FLAO|nr:carboxypeptidase-like regulatory domain-containing protein [Gillisia hiemivivida]TXD91969.1 carboxypeptidase-like regulatory domain-containing protein [Gillisia hiemivivida]
MKNIFFFLSLLLTFTTYCQTTKKVLIDRNTLEPIDAAHIYLSNKYKTGTVSNEDGVFILKKIKQEDTLQITHLNYFPLKLKFSELEKDTIRMDPITEDLLEVTIFSESAESILIKTLDLLEENHAVEPVLYQVFIRSLEYEKDKSQLHVFGEYIFNIYQTRSHNSKLQLSNFRVKPFSELGKEYFKKMRFMSATKIHSDNIFKYKEDIFKE